MPVHAFQNEDKFAAVQHGLEFAERDAEAGQVLARNDAVVRAEPGDEEWVVARDDDLQDETDRISGEAALGTYRSWRPIEPCRSPVAERPGSDKVRRRWRVCEAIHAA